MVWVLVVVVIGSCRVDRIQDGSSRTGQGSISGNGFIIGSLALATAGIQGWGSVRRRVLVSSAAATGRTPLASSLDHFWTTDASRRGNVAVVTVTDHTRHAESMEGHLRKEARKIISESYWRCEFRAG